MRSGDVNYLYEYASKCKFIIETGAGGKSTKFLARAAEKNNAILISIELLKSRCKFLKRVEYMVGWSVKYDDIIKFNDKDFVEMKKWKKWRYRGGDYRDGQAAHGDESMKVEENDLIRKALLKYKDEELDFFFCDSGEYCGLAEWNIVKDKIKIGGYFAIHDIYYPKSIKGFKVVKIIKKNKKWKIKVMTSTKQGLLIAERIK